MESEFTFKQVIICFLIEVFLFLLAAALQTAELAQY